MGSVCDVLCRWYTACSVQVESGCSQPTDSIEAIWKGLLTRKVSVPSAIASNFSTLLTLEYTENNNCFNEDITFVGML